MASGVLNSPYPIPDWYRDRCGAGHVWMSTLYYSNTHSMATISPETRPQSMANREFRMTRSAKASDATPAPRLTVTARYEFEAAHRLEDRSCSDAENAATFGICNRLHGHNYHLTVTVSGVSDDPTTLDRVMVVDFGDLDRLVEEHVLSEVEHQYLNDLPSLPVRPRPPKPSYRGYGTNWRRRLHPSALRWRRLSFSSRRNTRRSCAGPYKGVRSSAVFDRNEDAIARKWGLPRTTAVGRIVSAARFVYVHVRWACGSDWIGGSSALNST